MNENTIAYIGIGSNLGESVNNVLSAIDKLKQIKSIHSCRCSSLYRTDPVGFIDQPKFVNAVCEVNTTLTAEMIMNALLNLEIQLGRVRNGEKWGPRFIDLDLLMYGQETIQSENLLVPHPRMHERAFVLYPLLELVPQVSIPGYGRADELVANCRDQVCQRLAI